jgi:hypothetical protein
MKLNKTLTALAVSASFGLSGHAFAAGTLSGTDITNTVTLNYKVSTIDQAAVDSSAAFKVDNKVDMELVDNTGASTIIPGADVTYTYTLKNSGNKAQFFKLDLANQIADVTDKGNITIPTVTYAKAGGTGTSSLASGVVTIDPDATIQFTATFTFPLTRDAAVTIENGDDFNILATATATTDATGATALTADVTTDKNDTTGPTPNLTAKELIVFAEDASVDSPVFNGVISAGTTTTIETASFTDGAGNTGPLLSVKVINDPVCNDGTANAGDLNYTVGTQTPCLTPDLPTGYKPKAIPGALVEYTLYTKNESTVNATDVVFSENVNAIPGILDDSLANVNATPGTGVSAPTDTSSASTLNLDIDTFNAAGDITVTFTAIVE